MRLLVSVEAGEDQAAAKAKAKATRIARGTRGPKAKKVVKGNVTGVEITPVTAPAAAPEPATAQPAANASSAPTTGPSK